ncbi:RlmF-related methyltransferase, partial [Vibrio parahaemolyticus]|nr:RlmF-related methyltransferase [Vibrio parahaemolyticus]
MKNNNHNAKQAKPKASKAAQNTDANKAKPKRVKDKVARKSSQPAGKSEVEFIKIAKNGLHERNVHRGRYDFKKLVESEPQLKPFVIKNPKGEDSINFSD